VSPLSAGLRLQTAIGLPLQKPVETDRGAPKEARRSGFASWNDARECITELLDVLSEFEAVAREHGLSRSTARLISEQLHSVREANMHLVGS
jgi:hypothetical protein